MQKNIKQIEDLLQTKQTEDPKGELLLINYHFENIGFSVGEVERIINGINAGIPVPHILGYNIICGAKIKINKDTLNPGPETKTLTEKVIEYSKKLETPYILDLCTGSGAIGISIAMNIHNSICIGTDISMKAINIARENAYANNVRIDFKLGDLFEPLNGIKFDVIIANPPYVCSNEIDNLPSFVKDFAPKIAIDGGQDGLLLHRRILKDANMYLKPKGVLFLECEDNQDSELNKLFKRYYWHINNEYINRFGKIRGFQLSFCGNL